MFHVKRPGIYLLDAVNSWPAPSIGVVSRETNQNELGLNRL
jgi:hypothetical protein